MHNTFSTKTSPTLVFNPSNQEAFFLSIPNIQWTFFPCEMNKCWNVYDKWLAFWYHFESKKTTKWYHTITSKLVGLTSAKIRILKFIAFQYKEPKVQKYKNDHHLFQEKQVQLKMIHIFLVLGYLLCIIPVVMGTFDTSNYIILHNVHGGNFDYFFESCTGK